MKTDIYTKIILTVIALCMLFNIVKEIDIVPSAKADNNIAPNVSVPQTMNALRANADGSINVRMVAADVIEVKPAYNAEFKVVPSSSSTSFKIQPYSSSTEFNVTPSSNAKFNVKQASGEEFKVSPTYSAEFKVTPSSSSTSFKIQPYSSNTEFNVTPTYNAKFNVKQASGEEFKVTPAYGAVFDVRQEDGSYIASNSLERTNSVYPIPAKDQITIEYSIENDQYLTICNINGTMMDYIALNATQNSTFVNISRYASGIYIYSYGRISGKFIKD